MLGTLKNPKITADGTVWTVTGQVGPVAVTSSIDLSTLAARLGRLPSMPDVQNALVEDLRRQYNAYLVGQMATNPPVSVPDIEF